ncbi:Hypothetical protein A7982_03604 [Minicystis rosea]|nr:Hypothetical protein A7982_03604 [Minicystis rosea]
MTEPSCEQHETVTLCIVAHRASIRAQNGPRSDHRACP